MRQRRDKEESGHLRVWSNDGEVLVHGYPGKKGRNGEGGGEKGSRRQWGKKMHMAD